MNIREYARPATLDEAYELIKKGRANRLIGGCTFLKRTKLNIKTAVDLMDCGLDYITEDNEAVHIGAYASLHEVETSQAVRQAAGSMLEEAMSHLIGVQLRNQIRIGAHVASRYGFSDIIPTLLALNARVCFFKGGEKTLWAYMQEKITPKTPRDILTEIILPKENRRGKTQMMRLSYADYSIFCMSVSRAENGWILAGGNFPGPARLAEEVMAEMNQPGAFIGDPDYWAQKTADSFTFGSNWRGSAEYRRELCRIFTGRAIEELRG